MITHIGFHRLRKVHQGQEARVKSCHYFNRMETINGTIRRFSLPCADSVSANVCQAYSEKQNLLAPAGLLTHTHMYILRIFDDTSSTAQGGGGSFKKRKTIGEIGCCESRMSKQKH